MARTEFETRSKKFALAVIELVAHLPPGRSADVISRQVLRSATSIGANYREAGRAESKDDFIHKISIATKEAAETEYWLELITESPRLPVAQAEVLLAEAKEILAILVAMGATAKRGNR